MRSRRSLQATAVLLGLLGLRLASLCSGISGMSPRRVVGKLDRQMLTPNFDTYKLSAAPMFERTHQATVPSGTRATNEQLGGGIDFASTALRVGFNDLQPDRVFPHERFYVVSRDGSLLLLSLPPDDSPEHEEEGTPETLPLTLETLWQVQPPLQTGEIVSVCGSGDLVLVCRHGGSLYVLRRAPAPVCSTSLVASLTLSDFGAHVSDCGIQPHAPSMPAEGEESGGGGGTVAIGDCKKRKVADGQKDDAVGAGEGHAAAGTALGSDDQWSSSYYLLDAWGSVGGAGALSAGKDMEVTVLLGVVSRPVAVAGESDQVYGGGTACKVQRLELRRAVSGAAGAGAAGHAWDLVSSAGFAVGTRLPVFARLWPARNQLLLLSTQALLEDGHDGYVASGAGQGWGGTGGPSVEAADDDMAATGRSAQLVHCSLVPSEAGEGEGWWVKTYALEDEASGPLGFIGVGGVDVLADAAGSATGPGSQQVSARALPALGFGATTGLGMHDLHVLRVAMGMSGEIETRHVLSFPAVGYIQKGRPNKKAVMFSCAAVCPAAVLVDSDEGLTAYESNTRGVAVASGEYAFGSAHAPMRVVARQADIDLEVNGRRSGGGEAAAQAAVLGYQMVGTRVVALTKSCIVVFRARPAASGQEDGPEMDSGGETTMRLPNGMMIPEHLLDDW